jgi:hypothetical protein
VADGKLVPLATTRDVGGSKTRTTLRASTTTTTDPPTTTTTATLPVLAGVDPALEQTVWTSYLAALQAVDQASLTSDPDSVSLAQHLTDASLAGWKQTLTQRRTDGEYAFYRAGAPPTERLYGMTVKYPTWVDIDTCYFEAGVLAVRQTGAVVADGTGWSRLTATMWMENGVWLLAGSTGTDVTEAQCPAR